MAGTSRIVNCSKPNNCLLYIIGRERAFEYDKCMVIQSYELAHDNYYECITNSIDTYLKYM